MEKKRLTKIIATLGPSTDNLNNLDKLIKSGLDIIRLNFSHGNISDHIRRVNQINEICKKYTKQVGILGDLQGPKIRIKNFKNNYVYLHVGKKFILDISCNIGNNEKVGVDYLNLPNDVKKGDILLLDDGLIKLKVIDVKNKNIITKVIIGGILYNKKGLNKLGGGLNANALTNKDKEDIIFSSKIGVNYLAISFPKVSTDINTARYLIRKSGSYAKLIAKFERAETIINNQSIDNIIKVSDIIMIARGDLGVEINNNSLLEIQRKIILRSIKYKRIVILATQILHSMRLNLIPTRAEIIDTSNAILDGIDVLMLSGETAEGLYPCETFNYMVNICLNTEKNKRYNNFILLKYFKRIIGNFNYNINNKIKAVVCLTNLVNVPYFLSKINLGFPIIVLSKNIITLNLVSIYKGVIPLYFDINIKEEKLIYIKTLNFLEKQKKIKRKDLVIFINNDNIFNKCYILNV